jgi:hypothetical protein
MYPYLGLSIALLPYPHLYVYLYASSILSTPWLPLPLYLSICLCLCLYHFLNVSLSLYLYTSLPLYLSTSISTSPYIPASISTSTHLHLSIYLCLCLYLPLSPYLDASISHPTSTLLPSCFHFHLSHFHAQKVDSTSWAPVTLTLDAVNGIRAGRGKTHPTMELKEKQQLEILRHGFTSPCAHFSSDIYTYIYTPIIVPRSKCSTSAAPPPPRKDFPSDQLPSGRVLWAQRQRR